MNAGNPFVSVIINNFNYARFVSAAVESVLAQEYRDIEIIVVDDGSTDDSLKVLGQYRGRLKVIAKHNGGQASAFNAGFKECRGEIICFLDADDLFNADKVIRIVEAFDSASEADWVFDQLTMIEDDGGGGRALVHSPPKVQETVWGLWDVRSRVAVGNVPYIHAATSGLSFRRKLLTSILPMPESIRITSDNYIKFCSIAFSPGLMLQESFTLQRIHGANAYTHQNRGKRVLMSRVAVLTGIGLYRKSPMLRRFGLTIFSSSLGQLVAAGRVDKDMRRELGQFLRELPAVILVRVLTSAALQVLKARVRDSS